MPFDIVLVDDHKLVRDGVKTILERGAEFHVVGEAENGADAVQLCKKAAPDLVLMDIGLPGMNGIESTTAAAPLSRGQSGDSLHVQR